MLWHICDLAIQLEKERMRGRTIALVNGAFDIIHFGHVRLFALAKQRADIVVAALDTDRRVKTRKGPGRPVCGLTERAEVLGSLRSVDYVTSFDSLVEYRRLFDSFQPDLLVIGGEYRDKTVNSALVKEVVYAPIVKHTSDLLKRIGIN